MVQALVQLMQRPEQDVVCSAIVALALIRPIQAFNPIVVALFDARDEVRRNAAAAIGRLGDVRALEPLHAILDDSYHWVRSNAALSLAALHQ
ncbi:MAG: HEAT repeat domain-containing protein, partial [Coriobacteriales bacterium]|nr:HEAT repeat domain-containing protein [Coriobacteriales bacterium]